MKSNFLGANAAVATGGGQHTLTRSRVERYTVQQAATLTGLSEHTLRYYERIGLIEPVQRQQPSGHRRYDPDDLAKLETLACLRATGMPIDQMRRYFELRSEGPDRAGIAAELQALLTAHLRELHSRMAALQTHMKYVKLKIEYWRAVEAHDEPEAAGIAREAQELLRTAAADRSD
jgi:DNA-binding transcriptional MerR regulator